MWWRIPCNARCTLVEYNLNGLMGEVCRWGPPERPANLTAYFKAVWPRLCSTLTPVAKVTTLLTLGSFSPSSLQLHRLSLAASLQHKPVLHGIDLHAAYAYLLAAVKSLLLLLPIGLDRFEPGDPGTASSRRGH
jgi:hypothetical protein